MNINGLHIGLVINNNDPERRGRVQVFIPYLTNTLYEGWNKENKNISFRTLDPNIFNEEIHGRLIDVLPWSNVIMPCFGGGTGAPVAQSDAPSPNPSPTIYSDRPSQQYTEAIKFKKTGTNSPDGKVEAVSSSSKINGIPEGLGVGSFTDGQLAYDNLGDKQKKFLEELALTYPNVYTVTSAWRSEKTNSGVGGAKNSYHKKGLALDFRNTNNAQDVYNLLSLAEKYGATGVKQTDHIHIDWGNRNQMSTVGGDRYGYISNYLKSTNRSIVSNTNDNDYEYTEQQNSEGGLQIIKNDTGYLNSTIPGMGDGAALGMFSIPNVGAKVYVAFLNNNHMCPIVLGVFQEPSNVLASGITRETPAEEEYEQKPNFELQPSGVEGSPLDGNLPENSDVPDGASLFS